MNWLIGYFFVAVVIYLIYEDILVSLLWPISFFAIVDELLAGLERKIINWIERDGWF